MQFTTLALFGLSATAMAAAHENEKRQTATPSVNLISLLQILQTDLPASVFDEGLTNSAALASQVRSEFSHSETPSWFLSLPTSIQDLFITEYGSSAATASATATPRANTTALGINSTAIAASQSAILSSIKAQNSSQIATASSGTGIVVLSSTTITSTGGANSSSGSSGTSAPSASSAAAASASGSSTASSTAGASLPTAVAGFGLAGAAGLVALFAL